MRNFHNTRVYNLISVSQITRLLLGDAIISSKTDPLNGIKKEKKVRNDKVILKILSFIPILYLKQQSNILQGFCSLKFEKRFFSNKFSFLCFTAKRVDTAEKAQVKHFAQN